MAVRCLFVIIVNVFVLCVGPTALAQGVTSAEDLTSDQVSDVRIGLDLKHALECRRSIGLAGGMVDISGSWEFVGQGPIALTGSPILSMTCDLGGNRIAASFGVSSAPFYVQPASNNTIVEELLTVSGGILMGNQTWRYGALASVGYGYFGIGLRGMWLPWQTRKGVGRGVEVRVMTWFARKVGVQLSARFHLTAQKRRLKKRGLP